MRRIDRLEPAIARIAQFTFHLACVADAVLAFVGEVEGNEAAVAVEQLVAHPADIDFVHPHIGLGKVLTGSRSAEHIRHVGDAVQEAPVFQHERRMVHVVAVEQTEVDALLEVLPVVVLVGRPFRVHVPQHPLSRGLEDAAPAALREPVARNLNLEAVSELVGDAVERLVLDSVGSHPQCADHAVVGAAVGSPFERVVDHDHHAVSFGLAPRLEESHHVAVDVVEILHTRKEVVEVDRHLLPVQGRGLAQVVAEAFFPEADNIRGAGHAVIAPFGVAAGEIVVAQFLRDVDFLPLRQRVALRRLSVSRKDAHEDKQCCEQLFHIGDLFYRFFILILMQDCRSSSFNSGSGIRRGPRTALTPNLFSSANVN